MSPFYAPDKDLQKPVVLIPLFAVIVAARVPAGIPGDLYSRLRRIGSLRSQAMAVPYRPFHQVKIGDIGRPQLLRRKR